MKFENTEVWGFGHAFRGMRNPKNSWDKSDSFFDWHFNVECADVTEEMLKETYPNAFIHHKNKNEHEYNYYAEVIGENDMKLAQSLIKAGSEHGKFMRMIHVAVDVDMPRYWWSEADTYHFNTKNSCSTMHKLLNNEKPITLDMFVTCEEDLDVAQVVVNRLEQLRKEFKEIKNTTNDTQKMNRLLVRAKRLLMESFLQLRTWDTNYAELRNIYLQREYHPLKEEWRDTFCSWIKTLPYAEELIMYKG